MTWGESVRIETPEQIDFDLEVAGPGTRFVAQAIDWAIKWGVLISAGLLIAVLLLMLGGKDISSWTEKTQYLAVGLAAIVAFSFFFGYDIYFEGYCNGQTPGKRYANIRVVRDSGGPIDVTAAAIRNLVGLADFLPLNYLLGGFIIILNSRAQRLGDMAAGTVVVRERGEGEEQHGIEIERHAVDEIHFLPEQLDRCEPEDMYVIESFFDRLADLPRSGQLRLAGRLCKIFIRKIGYTPEHSLETRTEMTEFLASLYRDLKTHQKHG